MQTHEIITIVLALITSSLASSGLWSFLQKKADKKDIKTKMLIGLGHDRIMTLALEYIDRKYIYKDEYENLRVFLYAPYHDLGGNGSASRIMLEVDKLPIKNRPKGDQE